MQSEGERKAEKTIEPQLGVQDLALKRRPFVFVLCVTEGLVLSVAMLVLPWRADVLLYGVTLVLALGYLCSAGLAVAPHPALARVLRGTAWFSLGAFFALCVQVLLWSLHLRSLYLELGWALTGGLIVFLLALALFLVPFPLFVLFGGGAPDSVRSGLVSKRPKTEATLVSLVPLVLSLVSMMVAQDAEASAPGVSPLLMGKVEAPEMAKQLAADFAALGPPEKSAPAQGLATNEVITCRPESPFKNPWVVTFVGSDGPESRCLQGSTSEQRKAFSDLLRTSVEGRTILVNVLSVDRLLVARNSLLHALSLRPGLDGACYEGRCLLPFQLSIQGGFVSFAPLSAVPEARFGVDVEALAAKLSAEIGATLSIVSTEGFVLNKDARGAVTVEPLLRMSRGQTEASPQNIERAVELAENYIIGAQGRDGSYRYTLNPYSGEQDRGTVSLPRHAGTTLALCEISSGSKRAKRTVTRAVGFIDSHYKQAKSVGFYGRKSSRADLGDTALPLLAQLECAQRGYIEVPEHLHELVRFLLVIQREDGSFSPRYDVKKQEQAGEGEALFAAGQAIYSLVLAEQVLSHESGSNGETKAKELLFEVRKAIDRGMAYYAGPYWQNAPYSFFFLEENWHCLAARAALRSHRNDHYERFCIDYVTFKTRIVERSSVLGYRGAYNLSPIFAGHSTGAAGFGEASAAALQIADARGETLLETRAALRDTLGYLLQVQLDPDTCFACTSNAAWGGFTESPVSGDVRIDYVQHAMAALGHGGRMLGLFERGEARHPGVQ